MPDDDRYAMAENELLLERPAVSPMLAAERAGGEHGASA